MDEKQLQEQFVLWLAQQVGAVTEDGQIDEAVLQDAVEELGEEGIAKMQQQFMQEVKQAQIQSARMGAKLRYIDNLRSV